MKRDKKVGIAEPRMRTLLRAEMVGGKVASIDRNSCWVKVGDLREYTGWDFKKTDRMRKQGHVRFKREGKEMMYDLYSVPLIFFVKPILFHPDFIKQHA
jgi:hypothetical protein